MADELLTPLQLAYRAGVAAMFRYDTERSSIEDVVGMHEADNLEKIRIATQPKQRFMVLTKGGRNFEVMARTIDEARTEALADAGRIDPPHKVWSETKGGALSCAPYNQEGEDL